MRKPTKDKRPGALYALEGGMLGIGTPPRNDAEADRLIAASFAASLKRIADSLAILTGLAETAAREIEDERKGGK